MEVVQQPLACSTLSLRLLYHLSIDPRSCSTSQCRIELFDRSCSLEHVQLGGPWEVPSPGAARLLLGLLGHQESSSPAKLYQAGCFTDHSRRIAHALKGADPGQQTRSSAASRRVLLNDTHHHLPQSRTQPNLQPLQPHLPPQFRSTRHLKRYQKSLRLSQTGPSSRS